ncbi:MAG: transporter substrate-binding protein [Clostridia bacterium]|nr:transporter substrate-binding protein [Clostridia bacterium]
MKRYIAVGIVIVMLLSTLSVFTSCSSKKVETSSHEPITIEFWHNYDAGSGQVKVLEDLIKEFEAEHADIKVEHVYLEWEALKNNVVSGAATGTLPDVLRGDIAFIPQFQSLNVLEEMSSLSDYKDIVSGILEAPNSTARMGDKFYGIAANTNTKILFYNTKILNAANVEVPKTLDELWEAALKVSDSKTIGMVEPWTGIWNVGPYIWSEGGEVLSPDNSTAQGYINGPAAVKVIQKLADLYKSKALAGSSMDPGALGDADGWAAGTYALQLDGPWREKSNIDAGVGYGAIPLPAGSKGSISVLGGEDFMMFKSSDDAHKKAAWEFIKFMTGKHAQVEMAKVGQMPVNIEAFSDSEAIKAIPLLPVFSEALKSAKSRPVTANWSEMENIIATKVAEAITGKKEVQAALDEAAAEIDKLISESK